MGVKVSVIVPVYNAKAYLDRCMQHLLSQTLSEIEIILVDDGSTDDSLSICRNYAANAKKIGGAVIKVIHQSNQGPAAARNAGLFCAAGKWIAFVDPDDYVSPDYCRASYEYAETTDADIVMFDAVREKEPLVLADDSMIIEAQDHIMNLRCAILYPYMLRYSTNLHIKDQYQSTHKSDIAIAAPWNKLYKKSFLNDNNLIFPEQLKTLDDMTFNYLAFGCSPKVAYLHRKLYHYCFNKKSITNKYDPDRIQKDLEVFKMIGDDIRSVKSGGKSHDFEKSYDNNELVEKSDNCDESLYIAYYARVIKSFAILCRLCFFSPMSPYDLIQKLRIARNTMNMKEYAEAFDNIDIKVLEPRLKAVVFVARMKSPFGLYMLHVMQSTLQRIL
ncbi:glycosyltransferase family 2 protein [Butyrivibrio fibrisolvens]|uniref:glycosyltransferase family 2 protein n=1 Tax=Butyrivibrio fibrisolvens TaxID=831 RepID=UPI0020BE6456|nr:glycosyltransferase [Butyrivibrio fibrisolvens]